MSIDEALKILGLGKKFNEEELKKAYREKSKIYHSDKHLDDKENIGFYTKMQTNINVARDVLRSYLKQENKTKDFSTTYWDNMNKEKYDNIYYRDMEELNRLKIKYIQEIKNELADILKVDSRDKIFMKWKERMFNQLLEFYYCIDDQPNSISLKINYDVFRNEYFELICGYLYDHWNNSKIIDFVNGNLGIDRIVGINIVQTKMKKVITSILNLEMEKFTIIDNYNEIEPLLFSVRTGFVDVCLFGYINIDEARKDLKDKIVLEINKYNKRKKIIDNLTNYYGCSNMFVIELHNNILNEDKFYSLYNDNIDFKTKIKVRVKNIFYK